jgi:hypothetical protein
VKQTHGRLIGHRLSRVLVLLHHDRCHVTPHLRRPYPVAILLTSALNQRLRRRSIGRDQYRSHLRQRFPE